MINKDRHGSNLWRGIKAVWDNFDENCDWTIVNQRICQMYGLIISWVWMEFWLWWLIESWKMSWRKWVMCLLMKLVVTQTNLRSNCLQGEGDDAILARKGLVTRAMSERLKKDWAWAAEKGQRVLMNLRVDFWAHGPRLGPIIFAHIRQGCHYIWSLYLRLHNVGRVP